MSRTKLLHDRFREDQNGAIAIIFTLGLLFFCVLLGVAVDGSRAVLAKNKAAAALDSAAIAAATTLMRTNPPDAELAVLAEQFFRQNSEQNASVNEKHDAFTLNVDRAAKVVTVSVVTHLPTTFFWVVNKTSIDFTSSSQASFQINDIELGLVLDTTGSMKDPSGSGTGDRKIDELKVAASELFDQLLPDNGSLGDVKIGIAPFSASVNAGAYAAIATNNMSTDNCVIERTGSEALTDADPAPNQYFHYATVSAGPNGPRYYAADIDPTEGFGNSSDANNGYFCPTNTIVPLTNDKASLKNAVNNFQADYWTSGHLGTAWGWYLISPNWSTVWPVAPRPYGTKGLIKAIVVMTDGIYNTAYYNTPSAAQQAVDLCNNAKAQGVHVYTIGFTSPLAAEATLKACATADPHSGKLDYYHADSKAELSAAFKDIATKLTQLRLSE